MQDEFLKLLAAREGHFKLESGHHGNLWLDLDLLFLQPAPLQSFAVELAHRFAKYHPAAICGPLVGGALIAQMIAAELGVEFYYTERFAPATRERLYAVEYRLPASLRRQIQGKEVVLVDDVINAGSVVRGTLAEVRACGASAARTATALVGVGAIACKSTSIFRLKCCRLKPRGGRLTSGCWNTWVTCCGPNRRS